MKQFQFLPLKIFSFFLSFFFACQFLYAQENSTPQTTLTEKVSNPYKKIAIGLSTGTKGYGLDGAMTINRFFNVRVGFNFSKSSYSNNSFQLPSFLFSQDAELKNQKFQLDLDYLFSNIELLGEYKPFGSAFRIVGGLAFFPKNKLTTKAIANETYYFNDVPLDPDEIGEVALTWGYKNKISPYFGLGFGRAVPKKRRFGVSFDIGTYYKGNPDIGIEATAALRENVRNEPILEANLSKINAVKFFPVASLRFAYRIN